MDAADQPEPRPLTPAGRESLVRAVHDGPTMVVLAVAGGGNALITDLLDVGGASRTVLEIVVPYASAAMDDLVAAHEPDAGTPVVSALQAEAMARAALDRALALAPAGTDVRGVAITAALASDRPKRGEHRAHVAIAEGDGRDRIALDVEHVPLVKGAFGRRGEDRIVADAALRALARSCRVAADGEDQSR